MSNLIHRFVTALDSYFAHSPVAPWETYLRGSRDVLDVERRLNQLERGEAHHFGLD
jgi:hypothetical protein